MDRWQPLQDTFSSLAGVPVRRTTRPGEKFEQLETQRKSRRKQYLVRVPFLIGVLLKVRMS